MKCLLLLAAVLLLHLALTSAQSYFDEEEIKYDGGPVAHYIERVKAQILRKKQARDDAVEFQKSRLKASLKHQKDERMNRVSSTTQLPLTTTKTTTTTAATTTRATTPDPDVELANQWNSYWFAATIIVASATARKQ